uniref:Nudix hydrolase domain-containing protein n=1 Tax=viral metagenome TaxID=1070528 RepID=A0A6C0KT14_9ZZZZ
MSKNNLCNNCGKQGHQFHQCKLPITSYGIILFRHTNNGLQYLMIRRKDSFGYIDFIRGKYVPNNYDHLQNIFNEMSVTERNNILESDFETLWKAMWGVQDTSNISSQYKGEELSSQKKFEQLKNGIQNGENDDIISLDKLINNATTKWLETEWEFPKGRRNYQEKDLDCALREFEEETGLKKKDIIIIENLMPFEEVFLGSNHKSYKHKYFLAYSENIDDNLQNYQKTEVSKIEWKSLDECLESIRSYNLEKKQLIININKVLQEYRLY